MKEINKKRRLDILRSKSNTTDIKVNGYFVKYENDTKMFLLENTVPNPKANIFFVSPFGKTVHDLFLLTYYLNYNGFNVFRFDPRDHHGLSTGYMEDFTLHKLEKDVNEVSENFNFCNGIPTILLSMSLSFPVALKHMTLSEKIDGIIAVVGVVDPDYTILKATELMPSEFRKPVITAPMYSEPFGCRINNKIFVDGLDSGEYSCFDNILGYLKNINKPIYMIAAENDEYVKLEDVKKFFDSKPSNGELIILPEVTHEIGRSISAVKLVAKQVVKYALNLLGKDEEIKLPSLIEVIAQSEKEAEYINTLNSGM